MGEKNLSVHEPAPQGSAHPAIYDLIYQDLRDRDRYGREKYGVRLQAFNGRNSLVDAYQEVMDLLVYMRQEIYEREGTVRISNEDAVAICRLLEGRIDYCLLPNLVGIVNRINAQFDKGRR